MCAVLGCIGCQPCLNDCPSTKDQAEHWPGKDPGSHLTLTPLREHGAGFKSSASGLGQPESHPLSSCKDHKPQSKGQINTCPAWEIYLCGFTGFVFPWFWHLPGKWTVWPFLDHPGANELHFTHRPCNKWLPTFIEGIYGEVWTMPYLHRRNNLCGSLQSAE